MKKTKRTVVILLIVSLLLGICIFVAKWACGEKNKDGYYTTAYAKADGTTLYITGRPGFGKQYMDNISFSLDTWVQDITKVVIVDKIAPEYTEGWFAGMSALVTVEGLENLDISRVQSLRNMFFRCHKLQSLSGISQWDTSSVTSMHSMFAGCASLKTLNLSGWNTGNVTTMHQMFAQSGLTKVNGMENWNVTGLEDAYKLFFECEKLQDVGDLNNWQVTDKLDSEYAFEGCYRLNTIPKWAE